MKHIPPTGQQVIQFFHLGSDDLSISPLDAIKQ